MNDFTTKVNRIFCKAYEFGFQGLSQTVDFYYMSTKTLGLKVSKKNLTVIVYSLHDREVFEGINTFTFKYKEFLNTRDLKSEPVKLTYIAFDLLNPYKHNPLTNDK